ncbi:uncharacterized protein LY89DRAFT_681574 [Mollisia scopiformis]|uniref:Uncharacterized protein n=1 Tax=Mollisia scopiformis TaxID=149040 RepID=A0A194XME7_MOLSC|nr:uncharacterized protein LY89DRAFT_681574 [Mollisia scopiformis]KUJ20942.1 hypothetical protein LY89DRAFT_681574 [Mollisia scopiformis]
MADIQKETAPVSGREFPGKQIPSDQNVSFSSRNPQPFHAPANIHEVLDDYDDEYTEGMTVSAISDEDAQSLVEPSMSRMATRLKSPRTPALERAAAMEELEGGGYFDSGDETPPAADENNLYESLPTSHSTAVNTSADTIQREATPKPTKPSEGLSLGRLPSPKLEDDTMPITPWHAGPKTLAVQRPDGPPQSSLQGVFDTVRTRSLSGGAEALKKFLPKGLPNLFGNSSTSHKPKSVSPQRMPRDARISNPSQSGASSNSGGSPQGGSSPKSRAFAPIAASPPDTLIRQNTGARPHRPKVLRRSTSDDSLLYHSLSRASSLGDDTRFENHHEQVNSRVKAIRDSLQDRSSFRMPQMPSILPAVVTKRKPNAIANPTVTPGMVGAAVSRPEAAAETVRPVAEGPNSSFLDRAMESLTGDIVIMGGYRGSVLRSTQTNRQVWVPVKVGLNIRKVDLEVGLEPEDEERMPETIYASGMLQNIGPVDISKRLFKRLSECENARNGKLRVWDYGYDWRLSPHLLSRKLTEFLEKLPSNQPGQDGSSGPRGAIVLAHSLGGLITRHVVNHRPELFSGVVYAGVPHACVNILGPLRNGDAVLLSSRVLTAQVNFTLRTSFLLLPEDGRCFLDLHTKEQYPVDFFDLDNWIKYRWSPCTDPPLPPRNQPTGGLGSLLNMPASLLSLPIPGKKSTSGSSSPLSSSFSEKMDNSQAQSPPTMATRAADVLRAAEGGTDRTLAPQMGSSSNPVSKGQSTNQSISTAVTIPREKAIAYLKRTLAETKKFKQELHFKSELSEENRYPPLALIYGKSIPTVYGAKVDGREGIPCSDSYDNLAFASGDGVCLAKEAMLPEGYKAVYGGRISSDRGHVTLLGDLNAVGRALEAILKGRAKGIGLGVDRKIGA